MAKRRKTKRANPTGTGTDAALTALCGTSRTARRKYKTLVEKEARRDAEMYARFLRELGLSESATQKQVTCFHRDIRRTLASIYHTSIRHDADCSTDLTRLAYRLVLDPTRDVRGDVARLLPRRHRGAWVIHKYSSVEATLLPPAPKTPGRKYAVPFTVSLLDCVLAPRRDLPHLRNLIVKFLGQIPNVRSCLPANGEAIEQSELTIEIDQTAETVRFCGAKDPIAYTPFRIFARLCEGEGEIVSDATLIKAVPFGPAESTLRTHISEIRSALRRAASRSKDKRTTVLAERVVTGLIRKKRGVGYWITRPNLIRFI